MADIETGSVAVGKIKDGKFLDFKQGCRPWRECLADGLESTVWLRQSVSKASPPGAPLYKSFLSPAVSDDFSFPGNMIWGDHEKIV
jgi:hypothetical protein